MANHMSALDEIRELQHKALKYAEPVYNSFPMPNLKHEVLCLARAWLNQAKREQEQRRYDAEVRWGVERSRMKGIWTRLCRKWASKHDRAIPSMPGGY